jgi:hypothetical protein
MCHDFEARKTKLWVGFWVLDKESDKSGEKWGDISKLTHNYLNSLDCHPVESEYGRVRDGCLRVDPYCTRTRTVSVIVEKKNFETVQGLDPALTGLGSRKDDCAEGMEAETQVGRGLTRVQSRYGRELIQTRYFRLVATPLDIVV